MVASSVPPNLGLQPTASAVCWSVSWVAPRLKPGVRRLDKHMAEPYKKRTKELRKRLAALGHKLDAGDDAELLVWAIPAQLACAHRPLRKHAIYGKPQFDLPGEAAPLVLAWVRRVRQEGVRGIIALMGEKELRHYALASGEASGLIDLYKNEGLFVRHIPWEDPAHSAVSAGLSYDEQLEQVRVKALAAFDEAPKPDLLHCSSGIQRSSPMAAFIYAQRGQ